MLKVFNLQYIYRLSIALIGLLRHEKHKIISYLFFFLSLPVYCLYLYQGVKQLFVAGLQGLFTMANQLLLYG